VAGRPVLPANELVRQVAAAAGTAAQQLDLVLFLDGDERLGGVIEASVEAFRASWRRPKWRLGPPD
jgi:hypothetical protein